MKLHEFELKLERKMEQLRDFAENVAPEIAGRAAADFYKESFQNEGFTDKSLSKWKSVKRPNRKTVASKILVKTGNLKRSIDYNVEKGKVIVHAEAFSSKGFNYAPVHNFGEGNVPQRQFVGKSEKLEEIITEKLNKKLRIILRE